ncbi:MAG: hypothetical protein K5622_07285 [Endomicrobiaceae bacterium]|nr:hypothetical protein [Endomicrobiaceae bacterium]
MAEENKIPQLEALEEGAEVEATHKDFDDWHDGHMERVKEGLEKIIASDDLNEIKTIAKELLEEEKQEADIEDSANEKETKDEEISMADYIGGK